MKKLKNFPQQKPFLFILTVCVIISVFQQYSRLLFSLFPDNMLRAYVRELYDILWPVVLSLLFGFRFIYHRKGAGSTLIAGIPLLVWTILMLLGAAFIAFYEGAQWQTAPVILLGILELIGIGIREEVLYRGIIGNTLFLKYAKDKNGLWFAVIVSALIFGGIHITNIFFGVKLMGLIAQVAAAFGAGLLLAAIYLRGGNIWILILIHGINDAAPYLKPKFTVTTATEIDAVSSQNPLGAVLIIVIYTCLALFLLRKSKQPAILARLKQLRNQAGWSEVSSCETEN